MDSADLDCEGEKGVQKKNRAEAHRRVDSREPGEFRQRVLQAAKDMCRQLAADLSNGCACNFNTMPAGPNSLGLKTTVPTLKPSTQIGSCNGNAKTGSVDLHRFPCFQRSLPQAFAFLATNAAAVVVVVVVGVGGVGGEVGVAGVAGVAVAAVAALAGVAGAGAAEAEAVCVPALPAPTASMTPKTTASI